MCVSSAHALGNEIIIAEASPLQWQHLLSQQPVLLLLQTQLALVLPQLGLPELVSKQTINAFICKFENQTIFLFLYTRTVLQ